MLLPHLLVTYIYVNRCYSRDSFETIVLMYTNGVARSLIKLLPSAFEMMAELVDVFGDCTVVHYNKLCTQWGHE